MALLQYLAKLNRRGISKIKNKNGFFIGFLSTKDSINKNYLNMILCFQTIDSLKFLHVSSASRLFIVFICIRTGTEIQSKVMHFGYDKLYTTTEVVN